MPCTAKAQGGFKSKIYQQNNTISLTTRALFEISPGSYLTAGYSLDTIQSSYINHLLLMGLDQNGQKIWVKKYGSKNFFYYYSQFARRGFFQFGNHIFYVGVVKDTSSHAVGVLTKFNANGDTIWQKVYRDVTQDIVPHAMSKSIDGGFLITGIVQNTLNTDKPCLLIKTDINGGLLWKKILSKPSPNEIFGYCIKQDSITKKIIICGTQRTNNPNTNDFILVTDSLGNNPVINSTNSRGGIFDIISTKDGNYATCGVKEENTQFSSNYLHKGFIAKFNIGNPSAIIWKRELDDSCVTNINYCLKELPNGDIISVGMIDTVEMQYKASNRLIRLSKFSKDGGTLFQKLYNYKTNDSLKPNFLIPNSLELANDGSLLLSVEVQNPLTNNPFFVIKYDATGCDTLTAHCATANVNGVKELYEWRALVIFPNPTNGFISFENLNNESTFEVDIMQANGLVILERKITNNDRLDITNLNPGIYFLKIKNEKGAFKIFKISKL